MKDEGESLKMVWTCANKREKIDVIQAGVRSGIKLPKMAWVNVIKKI